MGLTKDEFFHSTPRVLKAYDKAYDIHMREADYMNLLLGYYTYEAVATALSNAFAKKGSKPKKYREKPILEEMRRNSGNLTEAEKIAETKKLFESLEMMKRNFEMNHKQEDRHGGRS